MQKRSELAVADVKVTINGAPLSPAALGDLLEVRAHEDLEAPSMLTLKLATWDQDKLAYSWVDSDIFSIGGEVDLRFGYVGGSLTSVMRGEITGIELEVVAGELPMLVVRGYDLRHRLLRGQKTRSFAKMKDSDIAAQIAREQKLTPKATDSGAKLEYVLQAAQSDLDFLHQRAAAIGYEVVVEGQTLHFRPHQAEKKAQVTLASTEDLIEFTPRLTAVGQEGAVEVRGWDPRQKKAIVGKAQAGQEPAMGAKSGLQAARQAFGKSTLSFTDVPVGSQAEADKIARGQLETMALGFIRGEGVCFGRADLKAGATVEIEGVGKRFSGAYYVSSVTHTYTPKGGYRTSFAVRRNAI